MSAPNPSLADQLDYLKLAFIREHFEPLAHQAAKGQWPPTEYLAKLVEGEALCVNLSLDTYCLR